MGPIYKINLHDNSSFVSPEDSYPFSVTKINQLLSFFVTLAFLGLLANTLWEHYIFTARFKPFPTGCVVITSLAILLLVCRGRTGSRNRTIHLLHRTTTIAAHDGQASSP
jgi:hypothetical protein